MSFTSPVFFFFLPIVLLIYWLLPGKYRWIHLLASSCFFYAFYDVRLLGLIFVTIWVSYLSAICMEQAETQKGRRLALFCTMTTCLGILFIFKYLNFAVDGAFALFNLFGADISFDGFPILLPMGISFYVFQTMSYTFDVYHGTKTAYHGTRIACHGTKTAYHDTRIVCHDSKTLSPGTMAAEKHLGRYALFVIFFPQLTAGPIERPGNLLPQLKHPPAFCKENLTEGFSLLLRGYAKKLLIADYLAGYVDAAYENISTVGGAALLTATFLFAIQIYCDFSGYTDIALGCARCMGIRLSENFRHPYSAISIRDFWQRWHISLTRWFTDYLYIPLGGSRKGLVRHCRNILLTFLVSGLWHGANWTFLFWGGLHGIYLIVETLFSHAKQVKFPAKAPLNDACIGLTEEPFKGLSNESAKVRSNGSSKGLSNEFFKGRSNESSKGLSESNAPKIFITALRRSFVFLLVCFAWIFFRAATLRDAFWILHEIFTHWQLGNLFIALGFTQAKFLLLLLLILLLPLLEKLPAYHWTTLPLSGAHRQCSIILLYFLMFAAIFLCRCLVLTEQGATSFIYFQF